LYRHGQSQATGLENHFLAARDGQATRGSCRLCISQLGSGTQHSQTDADNRQKMESGSHFDLSSKLLNF
jgi:hypothetical protein